MSSRIEAAAAALRNHFPPLRCYGGLLPSLELGRAGNDITIRVGRETRSYPSEAAVISDGLIDWCECWHRDPDEAWSVLRAGGFV